MSTDASTGSHESSSRFCEPQQSLDNALGNFRLSSVQLTVRSTKPRGRVLAGQYGLGETIGEGQLGKVRLGWRLHPRDQKSPSSYERRVPVRTHLPPEPNTGVAIKIFNISKLKKIRAVDAVCSEIDALSSLSHSNVIKLYEVIENSAKNRVYLVLELLEGSTLGQLISSNPNGLPETDCISLFRSVLNATSHCHQQGIAHRDIKPDNLMFTADKYLRLVDFSAAALANTQSRFSQQINLVKSVKLTDEGNRYGSPAFLPPELLDPHATSSPSQDSVSSFQAGIQADSWAIGVSFHIALCGRFPFPSSDLSLINVQDDIRHGRITIDPSISKSMNDLIGKLLDVNVTSRLTPTQALCHYCFGTKLNILKFKPFFLSNSLKSCFSFLRFMRKDQDNHDHDHYQSPHCNSNERASFEDESSIQTFSPEWSGSRPSSRASSRSRSRGRHFDNGFDWLFDSVKEDTPNLEDLANLTDGHHPPPPLVYEETDDDDCSVM
ncbi:hypothetical protein P9112_003655 [Eukaryota sp. TZLM1-RC]